MSSDGSVLWDAAEEVENNTERTPRDEARDGPVRPQELLPRGPPPPEPVCWSAASGSASVSKVHTCRADALSVPQPLCF